MSSNPSLALIGCGAWGMNIARTLHRLGHLAAIVDPSPTLGERIGDIPTPRRSLEEIWADPTVDGVVIATPTPTHFPIADGALKANKHVFVEKPVASTSRQIEALIALAQKKNRTLMVGHLLLYHSAFQTMVTTLETGHIGNIKKIETYRCNFGKFFDHESVGWDLGVHDMSMVLALMDGTLPTTVHSTSVRVLTPHGDMETIQMTFPSGTIAELHLSRLSPQKKQTITVYGTEGIMVFDDVQPWEHKLTCSMYCRQSSSWTLSDPSPIPLPHLSPLDQEMRHFIDSIRKGTPPHSPASQGLVIHQLLEKALSS